MKNTPFSFAATALSTAQQSAIRGGSRFDQLKEGMLADADSETFDR